MKFAQMAERYIIFAEKILTPKPKKPSGPKPGAGYADFGSRVMASTIDTGLSLLIVTPFFDHYRYLLFKGKDVQALDSDLATARSVGDVFAILTAHEMWGRILADNMIHSGILAAVVLAFWIKKGATPGKMLLRMRIVDEDTLLPPTRRQCLLRLLGYIVSTVPLLLGFVAMLWDKKHRGWHDRIAGTVVIQKRWRWPWNKKSDGEEETNSIAPAAPRSTSQAPGE